MDLKKPNRHVAVFFVSFAFIVLQFAIEFLGVSVLMYFYPVMGSLLYEQKEAVIALHLVITLALLAIAHEYSAYLVRKKRK